MAVQGPPLRAFSVPHVFAKVAEGTLARYGKWASGFSISSMARSPEQLCDHRDLVLWQVSQLGHRVSREKSKLFPVQRISFLSMESDSVSLSARLTNKHAQSMLNCLSSFSTETLSEAPGAYGATVTLLGLLHMRLLLHWLHSRVLRWAVCVTITPTCCRSFSPWINLFFLQAGVPLEQVSRHAGVTIDASSAGWCATCNGHAASGFWTGPRLLWHINCLELLAVLLALL